ncbi:MAG: tRNA (guanosine(46)-N7)-methyltransferase TrmB, partial [Gammaproteobacteria bacterium]|nr:tRNA (guanosine(46)-N7)-methyltransferase TrmB [Gammaproteobacteria bacterium]
LRKGGKFLFATDWEDYARQFEELISMPGFEAENNLRPSLPEPRPQTKYEKRGIRLGHKIHDFALLKGSDSA